MTTENKKIGIAGIGNLLMGDEGFGVHVANYLLENYDFPENVDVQDIGTAGIYMAPFLETCDPVFIIDVVDIEAEPGSYHFFNEDDFKNVSIHNKMSPHQLGVLEILEVCKLRGEHPQKIEFHTIVPNKLEETITLSALAEQRKIEIAEKLLGRLKELGVTVTKKDEA